MKYEKKIRFIAATLFLLFSTLTVIYAVNAHSGFKATKESIERVKNEEGVEVSLLRFKARDGTPLKALYYIDSNLKVREDHSVPLIVLCHGMSSDYFMFGSFAYTMAKEHGFAVVSIEARGHGSNPAPSTLGYKEGKDIVDLLDYLDKDVKAINTSKSGVFGHSMGGLYAMNGYIEESLGKGRLKGLVEGSGPLNITREAYFLTNNPFVVGENSLLDNLAQKNPVNRANQTFPQNMILWHGTEDGTVDYQCVIDFLNVIDSEKLENPEDPQAGRSDVEFYSIEGAPHNLPDNFTKFAIMHFNNLLLGENLTLDEVQEYSNPIRFKPAKNAYGHVLYAAIFMMVVVPSAVLAVRPRYFRGWGYWNRKKKQLMEKADQDQNNGGLPEQSRDEEGLAVNGEGKSRGSVQDRTEDNLNCNGKVQKRAKIFLLYFGTMLIAGLSSFITDTYVATELIYKGIFSAVLFGILYGKYGEKWNLHFRKKKEIQFITKKSINLDNAVLM